MSSSSSSLIPNHDHHMDPPSLQSSRKKRRKLDAPFNHHNHSSNKDDQIRWKSPAEQQTYSTKLIHALRNVRHRNAASTPPVSSSRAVREAADKALAISAKGRTRWSRAILHNRMKLRLKNHKKAKVRSKFEPTPPPSAAVTMIAESKVGQANGDKLPALEKRVKVLGRLVPGCRKLSFPNLLEEATDYIAALQMQVRTMAALAELLAGSNSFAAAASSMDIEQANSSHDNDVIIVSSDHDNPVQP